MRYFLLPILFFIGSKADMSAYHSEAHSFAQKAGSSDASRFLKSNEETLRKEQGYQGENVPSYSSEASLNSAAKTYEATERTQGKKTEDHKEFGFYKIAHDSGLKTDLAFDKEGVMQESFMKDKAGEVYKDPLKMVQGEKTEIKRRKREKYTHTCVIPKSFSLNVRRRYHYTPPDKIKVLKEGIFVIPFPTYCRRFGISSVYWHYFFENGRAPPRSPKFGHKHSSYFMKNALQMFGETVPIKDLQTGQEHSIPKSKIKRFITSWSANKPTGEKGCWWRNYQHHTMAKKFYVQKYQTLKVLYEVDVYPERDTGKVEGWKTVNPDTEAFTKKMNCSVKSIRCLDQVARKFEELIVKRPCWEDEIVYGCEGDHDNSCHEEDIKNCTLLKSTPFISHINQEGTAPLSVTTGYERTYECTKEIEDTELEIKGGVPFCFDGSCHQPKSRKDKDFQEVISKLNILKKMAEKQTGEPIHVFTGEPVTGMKCSVNIADFNDCCQSTGWGEKIGLANCSEGERKLALLKSRNQCHYLGSYCSKKILGFCFVKKHSYCCYGSRLEREVQVQGSFQVGKGFGSAEQPFCRGFTVEELSKLDFDKINLSPLFEELVRSKVRGKEMTSALSSSYKSHFAMSKEDMKSKFETRAENKGGDL